LVESSKVSVCGKRYNFAAGRNQRIGKSVMFKDMIISAWAQPETIFSHQQIEYFPIMASSPFPL
jgi:hypothetical protein